MKEKIIEGFEKLPEQIRDIQMEILNKHDELQNRTEAIRAIEEAEMGKITEAVDEETGKLLYSNETKRRNALKKGLGLMEEFRVLQKHHDTLKRLISEMQIKATFLRDTLRVQDCVLRLEVE